MDKMATSTLRETFLLIGLRSATLGHPLPLHVSPREHTFEYEHSRSPGCGNIRALSSGQMGRAYSRTCCGHTLSVPLRPLYTALPRKTHNTFLTRVVSIVHG
ncbi:hypothetical protein M438DRAFT_215798 [Aureobasidium pullulans EXF-150]|uniref:Uncharacterized protein n=1 Tax=Aureobasidium pullulans EXF-150 TaxID=1043002 RepID=A0A074YCH6_AURPU|nr:uncharacterized protein M438DRAFT_215798 [Aureobasidium pullulans EXF-150]KEQ84546.1 hypothetical protein M438DRAFT_215798 [Aureobasidium pullulans EXF-150]